jgi:preprotein translocase subunit SecY
MIKSITDIFQVPELKKRLLFTFAMIVVFRLGVAIPLPGINVVALGEFFEAQAGNLLGFLNMFSGGALARCALFALGVMPYINASIIMSLLQTTIPYLERLRKEGELGRRKITQITHYATVGIAMIQSFGLTFMLQAMKSPLTDLPVVSNPTLGFRLLTVVTLTTGTMFLVWLGEQITEKGIGNGISLIIFVGIIDRLFPSIGNLIHLGGIRERALLPILTVVILSLLVIGFVVWVETAQRRIPVQYAKRIIGRRMYGGRSTYLPLRVDQSGVIAVIFSMAVLTAPLTVAQFFPESVIGQKIIEFMNRGSVLYQLIYAGLIIFFCYFYTSITLNPSDLAENMKKWGGFIPGIRPGEATARHIERILNRLILGGALFVVFVVIFPDVIRNWLEVSLFFGGTALLIVVGVALDTVGQMESHLLMRHYEGFMKKGRIKGRWFNIR